jgi:hypothetical protein
MKMSKTHSGESNPFFGKRHTEEAKRKMSEAARHRQERERGGSVAEGCRRLIAAIIQQAIKDKAVWFLETELGKNYCAAVGVNPAKYQGGRS